MSADVVIPISLESSSLPTEPLRGTTRMVKWVQTMVGWRPCLWISPFTFQSEVSAGELGPCRRVAVLMDAGSQDHPERTQVAMWTIPDVLLRDSAPQQPINW
jgi:hypothetical protein